MSLSKKNLNKLNKLKNNKNLITDSNNLSNNKNIDKNHNLTKHSRKTEDPNNIFYSLIDNSKTLEETSKVNDLLRNSELNQNIINSRRAFFSEKLTDEDELYDEFNYLLDE